MNAPLLSRRAFLGKTAAAASVFAIGGRWKATAAAGDAPVSFFVVGDTHYLAQQGMPGQLDETSAAVTGRLIEALNRLPGTEVPAAARSGVLSPPRGLIHVGDLIDSGDKTEGVYLEMQQTEWNAWASDYGLDGRDGKLKFPVYELHGNHDAPQGKGLVLDRIIARNKSRPAVCRISDNGLHYSWDWEDVHFVNLGILVGTVHEITRRRRYAALDSLEFLKKDLAGEVAESGRPVVIVHHVDVGRYTQSPCDPAGAFANKEWDACDVRAFYEVIRGYNIAAIFYGHTHARNIFRWDGASILGKEGIAVFNVDNASHFKSDTQAFFHVEIRPGELLVREYATSDRWKTAAWSPMFWAVPLQQKRA